MVVPVHVQLYCRRFAQIIGTLLGAARFTKTRRDTNIFFTLDECLGVLEDSPVLRYQVGKLLLVFLIHLYAQQFTLHTITAES